MSCPSSFNSLLEFFASNEAVEIGVQFPEQFQGVSVFETSRDFNGRPSRYFFIHLLLESFIS
jgi:hypothetical protein